MTTIVAGQPSIIRVCFFTLGGEVFGVDVRCAREVVALEEMTVVPQAPTHLIGVANVRGHIVPIVDVRAALGLPRREVGPGTRLLVLEAAPLQAAVATEGILGLAAFDEVLPVGEAHEQQQNAFASGFLRREEGPAMLLDVRGLLEALRIRAPGSGPSREATPTKG